VSAGLFVYGRFIRVPRVTSQFNNMTAPLPAFVGGTVGLYKEFHAKRRIATELDNPDAFAKAILNVRDRLHGPPGRIQFGRRRTPSQWDDSGSQPQPESQIPIVHSDGVSHVSDSDDEGSKQNNNQSRWAEIRRANSQQPSRMTSWDALRKHHQPRRTADSDVKSRDRAPHAAESEVDTDQERAVEQAKFDAILEAERKVSAHAK